MSSSISNDYVSNSIPFFSNKIRLLFLSEYVVFFFRIFANEKSKSGFETDVVIMIF